MKEIEELVQRHNDWRCECVNLIPSENVTSKKVREILMSDLGHRYTLRKKESPDFPMPSDNFYCGTKYIDQIEELGEELACKVFNSKYAFLQPISGHVSLIIMLVALCRRGDKILCLSWEAGGYPGYLPESMPQYLGLKADFLPFNQREFNLDYEKCERKILEFKPKLVILGPSYILFPYDLKRIRKLCDEVDAYLGYDASHVLGLIAGKQFQQPLEEGADIMIGSTHKSFFGPQGGIILTNDGDVAQKILKNMKLKVIDNPHPNRIAALTQALSEFLRFGEPYAKQVVRNAQTLGRYLDNNDVPVRYREKGYTRSHQLLVDTKKIEKETKMKYSEIAEKLEQVNIIIDRDGRVGTQEVTRFGMKEEQMEPIAKFFSQVIFDKKSLTAIKREVISFRKQFLEIKYCD